MTLAERRAQLLERLQNMQDAQRRMRDSMVQLGSQIDQLSGAIQMLDQLSAEEKDDAIRQQGTATLHGDEIRAGETGEERQGQHGRVDHDGKAAP